MLTDSHFSIICNYANDNFVKEVIENEEILTLFLTRVIKSQNIKFRYKKKLINNFVMQINLL